MIWFLLATYFLGGGLGGVHGSALTSSVVEEWSRLSETIISEPDRAAAARKTFQDLRKEVRGFERDFARTGRQLNRQYKRHETSDEEVLATLNRFNHEWEAMQLRAIELRFRLRSQMTEDEWSALFAGSSLVAETEKVLNIPSTSAR